MKIDSSQKNLNYILLAFFPLQALPFLFLMIHPIYAALCSLLLFPVSLVALVVLLWFFDKYIKTPKFGIAALLYALSAWWHGGMLFTGMTQGFLE